MQTCQRRELLLIKGHSQAVATIYDKLAKRAPAPYIGTLRAIPMTLSSQDKERVLALFSLKRKMDEGSTEDRFQALRLLGSNINYFKNNEAEWGLCIKALPEIFSSNELDQAVKTAQDLPVLSQ